MCELELVEKRDTGWQGQSAVPTENSPESRWAPAIIADIGLNPMAMSGSPMQRTLRGSTGPSPADVNKEPVMQIFVMPVGLPQQQLRVAVAYEDASDGALLGCTRPSRRLEPLFDEHIELFNEAAGKVAAGKVSAPLVFLVQTLAPPAAAASGSASTTCTDEQWVTLATAHSSSDKLRGIQSNPHQGGAVALPMHAAAGAPPLKPNALLHCYVHSGYYVRGMRRHSSNSTPGVRDRRTTREEVGANSHLDPGGATGGRRRRDVLELEYACSTSDAQSATLHVRGRNASRRRALRLGAATLRLPVSGPWEQHDEGGDGSWQVGAVLPPGGQFEARFSLKYSPHQHPSRQPPSFSPQAAVAAARVAAEEKTAFVNVELDEMGGSEAAHDGGEEVSGEVSGCECAELQVGFAPMELPSLVDEEEGDEAGRRLRSVNSLPPDTTRVRSVQVVLVAPSRLQPVCVRSHRLSPACPSIGQIVDLELGVGWPADGLIDGIGTAGEWVVGLMPSIEWAILGDQVQPLLPQASATRHRTCCTHARIMAR